VNRRTVILLVSWLLAAAAAQAASPDSPGPKLRRWFVGVQANGGARDDWNVFARDDFPQGTVEERGSGGTLYVGHRFGDRFLLALSMGALRYDVVDEPDHIMDFEALVTGTVLFRERDTFQPFLRGGAGGGGVLVDYEGGEAYSYGLAAVAGGGFQIRLSSRFSLEWELAARFTNYYEIEDHPDDGPAIEGRVQQSHAGWRSGVGLMIWF
jgi:opacity protein-like surface antigen